MPQISPQADRELNSLSIAIGVAEEKIQLGTKEKDQAWISVMDQFDEFGLEGKEAKFIAEDGFSLTRQMRQRTSKLDSEAVRNTMFYNAINDGQVPSAVTRLWNSITVRTVDPAKLQDAILTGKIKMAWVESVLPETKPEAARVRRAWSKEDAEHAKILGIERRTD